MKITDLAVDRFGNLSRLSVENLTSGLNVIAGPDGAGKSTLLEFLRGVFCGFAEARRLQLLSVGGPGPAGGSVGVAWGSRRLSVIRHNRSDEHETLAINVREGRPEDAQALRKHLEALDPERIRVLFTSATSDVAGVAGLVRLALQDGIDLTTIRGEDARLRDRLEELRTRRRDLLHHPDRSGRLSELVLLRAQRHRERDAVARDRQARLAELAVRRRGSADAVAAADRQVRQRHEEWQAVVTDLRAVEDRLWGRTQRTVIDVAYVQESPATQPACQLDDVAEIDRQLGHIREVLKDLAESRRQVSLAAIDVLGSGVLSADDSVRRQRDGLRIMEQQIQALDATLQLAAGSRANGGCGCSAIAERGGSAVSELRRQIELACQELSRGQVALENNELTAEREALDRCEGELQARYARLFRLREERLSASANPGWSRLTHPAAFERRHCECAEHTSTTRSSTPAVATRQITKARVHEASTARPGDAQRAQELRTSAADLYGQWQAAATLRNRLEIEWLRLGRERSQLLDDQTLAEQEQLLNSAEAELEAAQSTWLSLMNTEAALAEEQEQTRLEQPSRVLAEASRILGELTQGRRTTLRLDAARCELMLRGPADEAFEPRELSRGTLAQAVLAFRIALVDEYSRRGLDFPILLDDVLVDCDEFRLQAAADVLAAAVERGRQVVVLTCQEHLIDLLKARGAETFALASSGTANSRPATPEPEIPDAQSTAVEAVSADSAVSAAPPITPKPPESPVTAASEESRTINMAPDGECLLNLDSPIEGVPSLNERLADALHLSGIRTIRELLKTNGRGLTEALGGLCQGPADLTTWQSEAHLLCCVPGLAARDAQLLVACGILTPSDLANSRADVLHQRIQRFRGSAPQVWHPWVQKRLTWPVESEVSVWIEGGGRARPLHRPMPATAVIASAPETATDEPDDPTPPRSGGGPDAGRSPRRRSRNRAPRATKTDFARLRPGRERADSLPEGDAAFRFYLTFDSPIVDAPSIGPRTVQLLHRAGVATVGHLLAQSADDIAVRIGDRRIGSDVILQWQRQARLMCSVPGLRGHDSQLLVACDLLTAADIAARNAESLLAVVGGFAESKEGQRILRSSSPPDADEVAGWIRAATSVQDRRAA
ncbi:MAG: DUF4332 domain-containing protein [Planctomyces sp.]|nr:DUF4332 domain-containing protein [Planctomyces sp.]